MYVCLDKIMKDGTKSIFKLTLVAASRANELAQGAQPLVKGSCKKVSTIALQEVSESKVRYEETKPKIRRTTAG